MKQFSGLLAALVVIAVPTLALAASPPPDIKQMIQKMDELHIVCKGSPPTIILAG